MKTFDWNSIRNLIVRNGWCHARVMIKGVDYWRTLHIEADPEGKNAPFVRDALREFKLQLARDAYSILRLTKTRNEYARVQELESAYREVCAGRDISVEVMERNISYLKFIVRTVRGDFFDVSAARCDIFTEDLLRDYKSKRIAGLKAEAAAEKWTEEVFERKMKSRSTTIKSSIQQARSLFAVEVMQEKPYRALNLPNLDAFMRYRAGGSTTRAWEAPRLETLRALHEGAESFFALGNPLWLSLALCCNFGMRIGSVLACRWDWFSEKEDGSAVVRIRRAKGGHSFVGVDPVTWGKFKSMKERKASGSDFLLPGTPEEREAITLQQKDWLRSIGYDEVRCPAQELRGLFANTMRNLHGLSASSGALGHSDEKTTIASYIGKGTEHSVMVI